MKRRWIMIGALALAITAAFMATPPGRIVLDAIFSDPAAISWDAKNAYARCPSAIAGRSAWPEAKEKACAAMSMCVDEGGLSWTEQHQLEEAMKSRGC